MLPATHRLRASADFATVTRSGHRARRGSLVVYLCRPSEQTSAAAPTRVGLIVGKRVGGSVIRHQVSRRLRAQLSERLELVEEGSAIVVRALPGAGQASSVDLGRDLDAALLRLVSR